LPSHLFPTDVGDTVFDVALQTSWSFALISMASWIGHALGASEEVRCRCTVAFFYYYRYVLEMDQLIDSDLSVCTQSAFSPGSFAGGLTLLHLLALRHYQHLFPPDSRFWDHVERYHVMWTEGLVRERDQTQFAELPLEEAMEQESAKAAPLYISCAAAAIAAGRPELLPSLERAATLTNMLMDLIDDCRDWHGDLADGRFNSFVALAAAHGLVPTVAPTVDSMLWAMTSTPLLDRYVEEIESLAERIRHIVVPLKITLWLPFLDDLTGLTREFRDEFRHKLSLGTTRLFGSRAL
jgi:hypothetical protein